MSLKAHSTQVPTLPNLSVVGQKNYSYAVKCERCPGVCKTEMKVRGFTLNYNASQLLHMHTMRELVFDFVRNEEQQEVTVMYRRIDRNKERDLVTSMSQKAYRVVYDKRRILRPSFDTVPYGYQL